MSTSISANLNNAIIISDDGDDYTSWVQTSPGDDPVDLTEHRVGAKRKRDEHEDPVDLTGEAEMGVEEWVVSPPTAPKLNTRLLEHQKVGVQWMLSRENDKQRPSIPFGGILADHMGLGKTVQILALVVAQSKNVPGTTLVVVPKSVAAQWMKEVHDKTTGLPVFLYAEKKDRVGLVDPKQWAIIITTYSRILADHKEQDSRGGSTPLSGMRFGRLVFDEATNIINPSTAVYKACSSLRASHIWALSGTPVVNKMSDLKALVVIICGDQEGCGWIRNATGDRFKHPGGRFMDTKELVKEFSLLLTRGKEVLKLPPLVQDKSEMPTFGPFEKTYYHRFLMAVKVIVRELLEKRQRLQAAGDKKEANSVFGEILALLGYLRIACNSFAGLRPTILAQLSPSQPDQKCLIEAIKADALIRREDNFAEEGLGGMDADTRDFIERIRKRSTKTKLVIEYVNKMLGADRTGGKVIIFSHSVIYLNILANELSSEGFLTLQIDGRLGIQERSDVLHTFKTDEQYKILLMTPKVGGMGLNITEANFVILCDPWWHKTYEEQGIARAHRMGQTRPVTWVQLYIRNTVEENIIKLQDHKADIRETVMSDLDESQVRMKPFFGLGALLELFVTGD